MFSPLSSSLGGLSSEEAVQSGRRSKEIASDIPTNITKQTDEAKFVGRKEGYVATGRHVAREFRTKSTLLPSMDSFVPLTVEAANNEIDFSMFTFELKTLFDLSKSIGDWCYFREMYTVENNNGVL